MTFRDFLARALAAIKGKVTRQQRRAAERQAKKDAELVDRAIRNVAHPFGARAARRSATKDRDAKHTRRFVRADETVCIFHTTQSPPWAKKRRQRRRNEIAAASRRANRRMAGR